MGAWSEDSFGNDEAQEWLINEVLAPLLTAVQTAIEGYLSNDQDDLQRVQMEAAVALAVDLSRGLKGTRYEQIYFGSFAKDRGIWDHATLAMKRLLGDEKWLSGWTSADEKRRVLAALLAECEAASVLPST